MSDRFRDNGDGTITDTQTNLMWEQKKFRSRDVHDMTYVYSWETMTTIFLRNVNDGQGLANHNDWRLPTRQELLGIVDSTRPNPGPFIDPVFGALTVPYNALKRYYFWTGEDQGTPLAIQAWAINFAYINPNQNQPAIGAWPKYDEKYARAVRG